MARPARGRLIRERGDEAVPGVRRNGVTLPSLTVNLPTFAGAYAGAPLISLANCNTATAGAPTAALRKAAGR